MVIFHSYVKLPEGIPTIFHQKTYLGLQGSSVSEDAVLAGVAGTVAVEGPKVVAAAEARHGATWRHGDRLGILRTIIRDVGMGYYHGIFNK